MQAAIELTTGKSKLEEILTKFPPESSHWNESQNRFQFIDRLLTECLGWEHPNIEVESCDGNGGRADYVLGRPPRAILEAKREAQIFKTLPSGKPSLVRKLGPLLSTCKNFGDAALQAAQYCLCKGAQIAIVCNGPQLVIFQSFVPGQSLSDGECYFFNGFGTYLDEFPHLWRLLSPEGIAENRALRDLSLHRNPRIPPKATTIIPDATGFRYRSPFKENLRSLAFLLLEDIQDDPAVKSEFYRECYVSTSANHRHLLLSKNIISNRYSRASNNGINPKQINISKSASKSGRLDIDDSIQVASFGARPIVVLGDVGVGKTSFFESLFEQLDGDLKKHTLFVHLNLGTKANLADNLKNYVISEIQSTLKENYGIDIESRIFVDAIYHRELTRFDSGIYGNLRDIDEHEYQRRRIDFLSGKLNNKDAHLHAALHHLVRGRNKDIIIVIDNADQRNFETQQEAFLIAQELAASRNALVFVSLRPSTFHQSKLKGALSGYQNQLLTIAPPPADEVIAKRIAFALRIAEGKSAPGVLEGIRLNLSNIVLFLKATLRSIRDNTQIQIFLSNITGGNTRLVIELITSFCGSPNVDSEKIVKIENKTGDYKVPLHEFAKHALLGEYAHYQGPSSLVACNVFDVSNADPREHFLPLLIISFLISACGKKDQDGFVSGINIISEMNGFRFQESQVRQVIRRLAAHRLLETPHGHFREISVVDTEIPDNYSFRATSIGVYHLRYWYGSFAFLDAVSIDTPIFHSESRETVFKHAESFEIKKRLIKTEAFKKYLEEQWYHSDIDAPYFNFTDTLNFQEHTFASVRNAATGMSGRQHRGNRG